MTDRPRVLVFAYSDVGHTCLDLLIEQRANVVGVFTHHDSPGESRWFRSVAERAEAAAIPVFRAASLADESILRLIAEQLKPNIIFSFYYRQMIPMKILNTASLGAFNMHGSLLPRYRGKAPVNWAVLNGEDHTGATLHHMIAKADAGDIVDQERVAIGVRDTAIDVMRRVVAAARKVLDRQLPNLMSGAAPRRPQSSGDATYFGGRRPEDGRIDWTCPSHRIFNLIRAVTRPFPGAFSIMQDGRKLVVWWAEIESGLGRPGQILRLEPLTIATADGAMRMTQFEWIPTAPADLTTTSVDGTKS